MLSYRRNLDDANVVGLDSAAGNLALYLTSMARQLGLNEYYFTVRISNSELGTADNPHDAEIEVTPTSYRAIVTFPPSWETWSREYLREVVIHELCHIFFNRLQDQINSFEPTFGDLFFIPFSNAFNGEIEQTVDRMSRAWAELLPLPDTYEETPEWDFTGPNNSES